MGFGWFVRAEGFYPHAGGPGGFGASGVFCWSSFGHTFVDLRV